LQEPQVVRWCGAACPRGSATAGAVSISERVHGWLGGRPVRLVRARHWLQRWEATPANDRRADCSPTLPPCIGWDPIHGPVSADPSAGPALGAGKPEGGPVSSADLALSGCETRPIILSRTSPRMVTAAGFMDGADASLQATGICGIARGLHAS